MRNGRLSIKESYDYGDTPNEQSGCLRLASSAFDVLAGTTSSSVDLVYYDRFSPINPKTQSRVLTEMTATLKVLGGGASWKGLSYGGDRLEVYYDSGVLEEDGVEVRRTGRFGGVRKG